ncbi:uncharacterized protein LOC106640142 [Copidosoma floridanum]|uniref:uncharacterized protein LOC106640142 n=1 Tax=Copidosoma floridanum TaxID=29053 RepID=UPI0006C9420E|nr:uncharacterized protein LOC106640142 [Copidosoma floridanum]
MFTKALVLVLVGVAFVTATPVKQTDVESKGIPNEYLDIINELDIEDQVKFQVQAHGLITAIIRDKLNQLERKIDEIAEKAKMVVEEQKEMWEARIEEAKKIGQERYEQLLERARVAIGRLEEEFKAKIDALQMKLKELIDKLRRLGGIQYY